MTPSPSHNLIRLHPHHRAGRPRRHYQRIVIPPMRSSWKPVMTIAALTGRALDHLDARDDPQATNSEVSGKCR